jgi:hypothetical protein
MAGGQLVSTAELFGLDGAAAPPPRSRRRREPFFQARWLDLASGERKRATRAELREAYRLLAKHRDLWQR